jgi:hypothetical protein
MLGKAKMLVKENSSSRLSSRLSIRNSIRAPLSMFKKLVSNNNSSPTTPVSSGASPGHSSRTACFFTEDMTEETLLRRLLVEDKQFHDVLLQFARKEFCCETVLIFDELIKYRNAAPSDKSEVFRNIYESFIKVGSIFEINLSNSVRQSIEKCIQDFVLTEQVELILEEAISVMLMDIFARFELSDMYHQVKNA